MSDLDEPTQQTVFQAIEELLAIGRFPNAKNILVHLNCTCESVKISTHVKAWMRELGPSYRDVTLAALRSGAPSEEFSERVEKLFKLSRTSLSRGMVTSRGARPSFWRVNTKSK